MTSTTLLMTNALALATVGLQVFALVVLVALCVPRLSWSRVVLGFVRHYALAIGFIVAAGAVMGSLYYSDIVGYEPCSLCWWQRVFIYPQMVLFGIALWRRDNNIFDYTLALSIVGGVIALYHSYIQYGGSPLFECGVEAVSCAKRFVYAFDYITIPLMSLSTLAVLGLVSVVGRLRK